MILRLDMLSIWRGGVGFYKNALGLLVKSLTLSRGVFASEWTDFPFTL